MISSNLPYLCSILGVDAIHLYSGDQAYAFPEPEVLASAVPGKPQAHFFFDEAIKTPTLADGGAAAQSSLPPAAAAAPSAAKPSMMEYLEKHNVAAMLDAAVNELATEQPADPFGWLSQKMGALSKAAKKK